MAQDLPPLKQVSQEIGTSTATLSRVLNGHPNVSERTRIQVLEALQERGYQVEAPKKRTAVKESLAFAISTKIRKLMLAGDPFFSRHLVGFQSACAAAGYYPILIDHEQDATEDGGLQCVREEQVCGVVLESIPAERVRLIRKEVPVVLMNSQVDVPMVDSVTADVAQAVREQVALLYEHGHRSIACFRLNPPQMGQDHQFWANFFLCGKIYDLYHPEAFFAPCQFIAGEERRAIREFLDRVLSCPKPATAILTYDTYAGTLIEECRKRCLRVPEDISIIGYDDVPSYRIPIPLTTFQQPFEAMASEAVRLIQERLKNPDFPSRRVAVCGKMIIRDSVAPVKRK